MTQKEMLQDALNRRRAAQADIDAIMAGVKWKNKTHAMYKILGLCAQCGSEKAKDHFYCEKCRDRLTTWANKRNEQIRNTLIESKYTAKDTTPYDNDNH